MTRIRKMECVAILLLVVFPVCGWLLSEIRWSSINTPSGRFAHVDEYLSQERHPSRVSKVANQEGTFFVAYSPLDTWLTGI